MHERYSLLSTRASRSAHSRAHVDNSSLPFPAFLLHRAIKMLKTTVRFYFLSPQDSKQAVPFLCFPLCFPHAHTAQTRASFFPDDDHRGKLGFDNDAANHGLAPLLTTARRRDNDAELKPLPGATTTSTITRIRKSSWRSTPTPSCRRPRRVEPQASITRRRLPAPPSFPGSPAHHKLPTSRQN